MNYCIRVRSTDLPDINLLTYVDTDIDLDSLDILMRKKALCKMLSESPMDKPTGKLTISYQKIKCSS